MLNVVPIPLREPLFTEPPGRPGDWWESAGIVAIEVGEGVRREAGARRLPLDLVAALLIEHALVLDDIAACGLDPGAARVVLGAEASSLAAMGPGRLHTSYVRMLCTGDRGYEPESDRQLARRDLVLPLRLYEAVRERDLVEICTEDCVDDAIRFEVAAASSGRFMREWSLRALLADAALRAARD